MKNQILIIILSIHGARTAALGQGIEVMSDSFDVEQTCPDWRPSTFEAWACVDFNHPEWGPLVVRTDGEFSFSSTNPVPPVPTSALAAGWAAWGPSLTDHAGNVHPATLGPSDYSNGTVRAKVNLSGETLAFIPFRVTSAGEYWFQADGLAQEFRIARSQPSPTLGLEYTRVESLPDVVLTADTDWWMEGTGIGDQLSLKVWRDGDPEPAEPQLSITDTTYNHGWFGVGAAAPPGLPDSILYQASFDDVSFRSVPEPNASVCFALGLVGVAAIRRRRSKLAGKIRIA